MTTFMTRRFKTLAVTEDKLNEVAASIDALMDWSSTPQGHSYWSKVCADLRSLAREARNKMTPSLTISGDVGVISKVLVNGVEFVKKA